ncbi:Uncharacterized [Moorella glycerini]|uniref:Uncharacterized protein n=1 Tax=Neomoorella stamsii TaxID=1266720 RepID=A0A9X7J2S6_9FIRM|nr:MULTISPECIES: hypothetical protein [Moorella]PRR72794.1 hypothetical protein MOST_16880 [Moorella stamsii]CEP66269.1 Uncharacterized [Moorella glycerini]CEP68139.1 Uncharacterized [Moorella glycerini]
MPGMATKSESPIEFLRKALKKVYMAFIKHNLKYLEELNTINPRLKIQAQEKVTLPIPPWQHILADISKLAAATHAKIQEGVLFSNKAVSEVREFFEGTDELLRHTQDLLLTQNPILRQYILDKVAEYENKMRHFTTEHEERLIKGICLPRSSNLYLALIDAFKDMIWRLGIIAKGCE